MFLPRSLTRYHHQLPPLYFPTTYWLIVTYLQISTLLLPSFLVQFIVRSRCCHFQRLLIWLSHILDLAIFFTNSHSSVHANSLRYVHWCDPFSNYRLRKFFPNLHTVMFYRGVYLNLSNCRIWGCERTPFTTTLLLNNIQYLPWDLPNGPKLKGFNFNWRNIVMPSISMHTKSSISHTLTH